ncbi:MAG: oxygen-independent coproporphyrinogen III oxidase [candidate division Zixibacteria bacterium]
MIRQLLHKYDRPGPRYTSYPTVPEWPSEFGPSDYMTALDNASQTDKPLSMYIHIPFCRRRCYYCGCNTSVTSKPEKPDHYLNIIDKELQMVAERLKDRNRLIQMHWGGGTPTYLSEEQLMRLFNSVKNRFVFENDAEIAIEVDPRITTPEQLNLLRNHGFNRISFGVQDFTPAVQKAIGRNQTHEETEKLFNHCRELGFTGINIDLIYGLPFQTVENFSDTIQKVIDMGADRVAVYSYAHLPSIKEHQRKIDENRLPQAELKYDLIATAVEKFLGADYVQIGMDHFARTDDELVKAVGRGTLHRNFMGYTSKLTSDMIGIGMSAIGDIGGCFTQNISELNQYMDTIEGGQFAISKGIVLSEDDEIRRWAIISIMCNGVLNFTELKSRFGVSYSEYFAEEDKDLSEFISDKVLNRSDEGLTVLPGGMIFVRNIAMVFDAYLRDRRDEKTPLFSRTI